MAQSNLKPPSKRTVKFLYNGIVAFYPNVAKDAFGLGRGSLPYHESWGGYKRLDFLELALNTTNSDSVDEAAKIVRAWNEGKEAERTVPEKLDELVADLEEKQAKLSAYEKQKLAKEALLESQRAKETALPTEKTPSASSVSLPASPSSGKASAVATPAASEAFSVGIKINPQTGKVFERFANRVATAPVRAAVAFAAPTIAAQQGGAVASAFTLWTRGITSESLENKTLTLEAKEAKRLNELVKAVKGIETGNPLQTRLIRRAFPIKDIDFLLRELPQGQVAVFFGPQEAGGTQAIPRRSFLGNLLVGAGQQLFGNLASKAVKGLVSKATKAVAAKVVGAGAGTAVGGPVGSAIGYAAGWFIDKTIGKVLDFLREHKEVAYALLFSPLAIAGLIFGIPLLTVAGGVGIAVSLTGGTGALATGIGSAVSGFFGALGSAFVATIATPVIVALISIPVAVAFILFIINSGAYVVPPTPLGVSLGLPVVCTQEKGPIAFPNTASSPIARRAWEITADLYQGFWCYWNRSPGDLSEDIITYPPSYPQLFDIDLFRRNPNPPASIDCGDCMFWCTYLVNKAYGSRLSAQNINSLAMKNDFDARGKFIASANATPQNVVPGSVIFFQYLGGRYSYRINHVAIVYSVNSDGIVYVQSNSSVKNSSLSFNRSGRGIQSFPGVVIHGVGIP